MAEPTWRTTTVLDLIKSMRHARDFSATPILADALEEAGYTDQAVLAQLREDEFDYLDGCRVTAPLFSDKGAEALLFVENFAEELGGVQWYDELREDDDYDSLMQHAATYLETGSRWHLGSNEGYWDMDIEGFWKAYEAITGAGTAADNRHHFFSCAC